MQKYMNLLLKKNQSTQRIEDMANDQARTALYHRVTRMVSQQAAQPGPQARRFEPLSNPIQMQAKS
jgi:hypothetical protein